MLLSELSDLVQVDSDGTGADEGVEGRCPQQEDPHSCQSQQQGQRRHQYLRQLPWEDPDGRQETQRSLESRKRERERERERQTDRQRQRDRENSNSNSKKYFTRIVV